MRTFEIILAVLVALRLVLPVFRIKKPWLDWLSLATLGVMVFQWGMEGARWQMYILYGISLGLAGAALWRLNQKSGTEGLSQGSVIRSIGGVILVGIAIIPAILLPVPTTPEPTGPYKVGTITLHWVDDSRGELYSGTTGEPREIMVQIWYPAEPEARAKPAPWLDNMDVMGPALAVKLGLPNYFLSHVKYAHGNAYADAPVASGSERFPVLLFSHGWGGFRAQNTSQAEQLASYGYVVAAPDHTYGAIATVFPDGRVALNNPAALPADMGLTDEEFLAAAQLLGDQWAGDLSFILDTLENLTPSADDPAGILAGRLDFERVGALGHSTGGGAAIQFCATDARCEAALGMDPYMDPVSFPVLESGLSLPYLAMFSETWALDQDGRNNGIFARFSQNSSGPHQQFYIEGTEHYDFTDMPAFSPLAAYLGLKGPVNGEQVIKIVRAYSLAFFDEYLKGEAGALAGVAAFPEVVK